MAGSSARPQAIVAFFFASVLLGGSGSGVGGPLLLTKFLDAGKEGEGRTMAAVPPLLGNITSYSGFFTVNRTAESNLFFWYFPSLDRNPNAPLVLWLNGFKASSVSGVLSQIGPYKVGQDGTISTREYNWHGKFNMLYIDSPVGTGFSYTRTDSGYPRNQEMVGEDLFEALKQFYKLFPSLRKNELYFTGLSYAGKYLPALHHAMSEANYQVNFQGCFLVSPQIDPEKQLRYGEYLHQLGLISTKQKNYFQKVEEEVQRNIRKNNSLEANALILKLIRDLEAQTTFNNFTGLESYYDYLDLETPKGDWKSYVQGPGIRKKLHVGSVPFQDGSAGVRYLKPVDFVRSVKGWVEGILGRSRLMIISGQQDIIAAYPMMAEVTDSLEWAGRNGFVDSERRIWMDDGEVAGYVRNATKLVEVMLRKAAHVVPVNQPRRTLMLVQNFVFGYPALSFKE